MVDPGNVIALDDIAMLTGQRVRPIVVSDEDLTLTVNRVLGVDSEVGAVLEQIEDMPGAEEPTDLRETTDDEGPTVRSCSRSSRRPSIVTPPTCTLIRRPRA